MAANPPTPLDPDFGATLPRTDVGGIPPPATPLPLSCPTTGALLDLSQIGQAYGAWIYNASSTQVQLFSNTGRPEDVLIATLYQDDGLWISVPLKMTAKGVGATGSLTIVVVNR